MHFPTHRPCVRTVVAIALVALAGASLFAQAAQPRKPCGDYAGADRPTHCEVREQMVPVAGDLLTVDATPNGGVSVRGWDRHEIQLQAKVTATGETAEQARALAGQVRVLTDGGRIRAEGPHPTDRGGWSVSFDLMVPAQGNLDLRSTNGGISIEGVQGRLAFRTTNGGIHLKNVNGDVRGATTNGGVRAELDGSGWYGEGLEVETQNGGVHLAVPDGYSARLDASTRNGGLRVDFPVTLQGRIGRTLTTDLGNGGAPIRLRTTNGGVTIERR